MFLRLFFLYLDIYNYKDMIIEVYYHIRRMKGELYEIEGINDQGINWY